MSSGRHGGGARRRGSSSREVRAMVEHDSGYLKQRVSCNKTGENTWL